MAESLHNLADRVTKGTTTAIHGIHGTGDAIRGTINSSIDGLVPNHESKDGGGRARNEEIARRGMGEMRGAEVYFRGAASAHSHAAGPEMGGRGGVGGPVSRRGEGDGDGDGGWVDAASAGAGGGWGGASLGDFQRQERERERLWEQERREREVEFQREQQQQFQQQQQQQQQQQFSTPAVVARTNPGFAGQQPSQSQGVRNGHHGPRDGSGGGAAAGHGHGLGQKIFHHQKAPAGGEGKWLSQGGVREAGHHRVILGQNQAELQPQAYNPGTGAARLAWAGGQR